MDIMDPAEKIKKNGPFADTSLYRLEGIIPSASIGHARDYAQRDTLVNQCMSVIADETIGAGIAVKSAGSDMEPAGIWRWNTPDTLRDIEDLLAQASRHFHVYGFVVLAVPRDPLCHMRDHARGPGKPLLESDGMYPPQRLRFGDRRRSHPAAPKVAPLTAGDRMGHEWVCGARLIDPADLGCDFAIYKSFTHDPSYYILPQVPDVTETDPGSAASGGAIRETPLTTLLREFRVVTYPSGREHWRPLKGQLFSPVARVVPDAMELAARKLHDADAIAKQTRGTLVVEMHPLPKPDISLTPQDIVIHETLKKQTQHRTQESLLPPVRVPIEVDDNTHTVPISTVVWNLNTDMATAEQASFDGGNRRLSMMPSFDAYDARRLQCFSAPETARDNESKMLIKLPPHVKMTHYERPVPHVKETADFDNSLRNKTLQIFGLRENAFAATSVTNALASSGTRAISDAQTTAVDAKDRDSSGSDAVLSSALSHPSVLSQSRLDLAEFFEFLVEEALRPLLATGETYVRSVRKCLAQLQEIRSQWDGQLIDAVEAAERQNDTDMVNKLAGFRRLAARDREKVQRAIVQHDTYIQGLGIALDRASGATGRVTVVFDQPARDADGVQRSETKRTSDDDGNDDGDDGRSSKSKKKRKSRSGEDKTHADKGSKRPKRPD